MSMFETSSSPDISLGKRVSRKISSLVIPSMFAEIVGTKLLQVRPKALIRKGHQVDITDIQVMLFYLNVIRLFH